MSLPLRNPVSPVLTVRLRRRSVLILKEFQTPEIEEKEKEGKGEICCWTAGVIWALGAQSGNQQVLLMGSCKGRSKENKEIVRIVEHSLFHIKLVLAKVNRSSVPIPTPKLLSCSSGAWRRRAPPPPLAVDFASSCLSPIAELSSSLDSGMSSASPEPFASFDYGGGRRRRLDSFPPIVEDFHLEQIIG